MACKTDTTMNPRRHALLALCALPALVRSAPAHAQAQAPAAPEAAAPPPALPPQMPMPVQPPGSTALQLPHEGRLQTAPDSAATRRNLDRPTVAIREFRSSVPEIAPRGATDMFISALVRSRRFRVLERSRLAEGAAAEKALNQQGMTTGQVGQSQYVGATYLFEATISGSQAGERSQAYTLNLAGAAAGRGSTTDSFAIDVRIVDVESGIVVDAVSVRKEVKAEESRMSGMTTALANLFTRGRGGAAAEALAPGDTAVSARKESLDAALREAMETAVADIARRLPAD